MIFGLRRWPAYVFGAGVGGGAGIAAANGHWILFAVLVVLALFAVVWVRKVDRNIAFVQVLRPFFGKDKDEHILAGASTLISGVKSEGVTPYMVRTINSMTSLPLEEFDRLGRLLVVSVELYAPELRSEVDSFLALLDKELERR